ncbi:MAG TPA: hypothetical protein VG345_04110, partial [Bryobacteraceae bacterium]|nr:hypothetical protein [Bryobacteraceae bacterium]
MFAATRVPKYSGAAEMRLGCILLYLPKSAAFQTRAFFARGVSYAYCSGCSMPVPLVYARPVLVLARISIRITIDSLI